jgi:hypothetical protein
VLSVAGRAVSDCQDVLVADKDSFVTAQETVNYLGVSRPTLILRPGPISLCDALLELADAPLC